MTYRFSGGSNPLGGSGPPATYFDPNKTDEPARAASLTKLYGKPTCYGGRAWAWTQAPVAAWSVLKDSGLWYEQLPGGGYSHPECMTACTPPIVRDTGCDAGNAPVYPASAPASSASVSSTSYPWKAYSADTEALQKEANKKLANAGYIPISTDGKLGPGTCGAVKAMGMLVPSTCQSFVAPTKANAAPTKAAPGPTLTQATATRSSWQGWAIVGGVAVLGVGIGAAVYLKKRK